MSEGNWEDLNANSLQSLKYMSQQSRVYVQGNKKQDYVKALTEYKRQAGTNTKSAQSSESTPLLNRSRTPSSSSSARASREVTPQRVLPENEGFIPMWVAVLSLIISLLIVIVTGGKIFFG